MQGSGFTFDFHIPRGQFAPFHSLNTANRYLILPYQIARSHVQLITSVVSVEGAGRGRGWGAGEFHTASRVLFCALSCSRPDVRSHKNFSFSCEVGWDMESVCIAFRDTGSNSLSCCCSILLPVMLMRQLPNWTGLYRVKVRRCSVTFLSTLKGNPETNGPALHVS